jgi:guanylate kinase
MLKGVFVAISGPSGVGKGTIMNLLRQRLKNAVFVLSHTTRQMRAGEADGVQYHFVSKEEFERGIAEGEFLEYAQVHQKDYYGILKKPVEEALNSGKLVLREVDVQGAENIRKTIPKEQLLTVFIKPPSMDLLREHIEKRGHLSEEEIERRMVSAEKEMLAAASFDYQVVNPEGEIETCYLEVESIIQGRMQKAGLLFEVLKG